jgi:hypothetical protein
VLGGAGILRHPFRCLHPSRYHLRMTVWLIRRIIAILDAPFRGENTGPGKDDREERDIQTRNWRTESAIFGNPG